MRFEFLLLVILAPFPFWALGLPWLAKGDKSHVRLAPLVGCALAGLYAQLAMMAEIPARTTVGILVLVSAVAGGFLHRRHPDRLANAFLEWVPFYLVAVLAASLSPFPVLGNWDGDWLLSYKMGQAVIDGALDADMLARPPLFGAAATPLWIGSDGLISYQIMAAVASAGAVTATLSFLEDVWEKLPRHLLWPLLLSPFFLHHTAAAWAKLLAAGLILASIKDGHSARRLSSSALFALAVAVHEGSIVWAPCVLVANMERGTGWRGFVRGAFPILAAGILLVAPFQMWIVAKYGLAAKVAASPVMEEASRQPFLLKSLLAVVTTFVGWGPITNLVRWLGHANPGSAAVVGKEAFWLSTSWITTLSGTMVGLLFPFLLARRWLRPSPGLRNLLRPSMLVAVALAVLANALLTPFYGHEGTMQAALVPLALGAYALMAGQVATLAGSTSGSLFRRMAVLMGTFGTIPWLILNLGTTTGLWLSTSFRARMGAGSEGDYFRVLDNGLRPLGMTAFPEVPLLCLILLMAWLLWRRANVTSRPDALPSMS